jgi:hypothetical protein
MRKGEDNSPIQLPLSGVTKIHDSLQQRKEKKTNREGNEMKFKQEDKSSARPCPQGCEDQIDNLVS